MEGGKKRRRKRNNTLYLSLTRPSHPCQNCHVVTYRPVYIDGLEIIHLIEWHSFVFIPSGDLAADDS